MGFNDNSNTGIQLGLDLSLGQHDHHKQRDQSHKERKDGPSTCNKAYPSLTLGLSDHGDEANNQPNSKTEISSRSAVSSLVSNSSSIKRKRDNFLGEDFEVEVQKVTSNSKGGDVEDEVCNTRKKLRLTKEQSAVLEENFVEHSTLNPKQKQELAMNLNLRTRQVEVWFQNRRARTKLKQTETDCELLKKYCETLTEENKRLKKELQELKSIETSPGPFPMQIPSATLIICPSCERICNGNINGYSPMTMLHIGSKAHHHLYTENIHSPTHLGPDERNHCMIFN
ncbi:hypothetical protein TanjilG_01075 [Lupinus angustifolius]|uniref:Homeobox domain-containing protein n=1 Tax=Lupinus angustifolius TaxID=3871 RepID=A0A1J7HRW8_LUPAN|nr:PREDICTED: homeobox-leucine zipper protein HOX15-like [Lupinus angustifolius]OIW15552.1 hypothetical protein TanjilG_01075 [Lupinus angustifolius]